MVEDIIIGKEYMSNNYGPFVVLEELRRASYIKYYKIQFKWSTCINIINKRNILNGNVGDPWYGININEIQYSNNYGPFKVLEFIKGEKNDIAHKNPTANIQFIKTNNIITTQVTYIKTGTVKDNMLLGIIPIDTIVLPLYIREFRINYLLHQMYNNMINRCHNINEKSYNRYGAIGVKVCDRWLESFDNFYNDVKLLPQYNKFERWPTLYQLDKDWIQYQQGISKEQRIYSPETCMFLYNKDNTNLRTIEYHNNHLNELLSIYYGVSINSNGNYDVRLNVYGKNKWYGTYTNEIAAANMYNHIYDYYHKYVYPRHELIPLYNDIPYMSWNEFMSYKTPPLKQLYTLTNEPTIDISEFIEKYKITKDDILS